MEMPTQQQRIVVDQELLDNSETLLLALEELYLSESKSYKVYVHRRHLAQLDGFFDQIIFKHGIRAVNFDYYLMDSVLKPTA